MPRIVLKLLTLAALVVSLFVAPAGAQYAQVLTCNFSIAQPGDPVQATGDGFLPGSGVQLSLTDETLPDYASVGPASNESVASAFARDVLALNAGDDSSFTAGFVIPADTPDGDYFVLADGTGLNNQPRALVCRVEIAGQPAEPDLAFTGSSSRPVVQIGLAAVAMGALLVFVSRRKRTSKPVDAIV